MKAGLIAALLLAATPALANDVIRHRIPNSDFPIARAVEVPAGRTTVYVSGAVPPVYDANAPMNSIARFGDTRTQTINTLRDLNLTHGDVVKMQVFLVGSPDHAGRMDFAGFMEGYREFYGTAAQPNLPARSVMQIAGLVNTGWLVEIEVTAVRP
jgi:enamine deaminase RidA (YjgF/YER057c/UK114 family)